MRALIAAVLMLAAAPAWGEMKTDCGNSTYADIAATLSGMNERVIATAKYGPDAMLHIFASPNGKSWTAVTVRKDNGKACMVAVGTDWGNITTFWWESK